jgi:hypothetical protein
VKSRACFDGALCMLTLDAGSRVMANYKREDCDYKLKLGLRLVSVGSSIWPDSRGSFCARCLPTGKPPHAREAKIQTRFAGILHPLICRSFAPALHQRVQALTAYYIDILLGRT